MSRGLKTKIAILLKIQTFARKGKKSELCGLFSFAYKSENSYVPIALTVTGEKSQGIKVKEATLMAESGLGRAWPRFGRGWEHSGFGNQAVSKSSET